MRKLFFSGPSSQTGLFNGVLDDYLRENSRLDWMLAKCSNVGNYVDLYYCGKKILGLISIQPGQDSNIFCSNNDTMPITNNFNPI